MVKKKEKWLIAQVKKDDCHVLGTHTLYVHISKNKTHQWCVFTKFKILIFSIQRKKLILDTTEEKLTYLLH